MDIIFTLLLLSIAALALLFFARFTRYGTVDFKAAWSSFTLWFSASFVVLGQFFAEILAWLAQLWDPIQAQWGDLFAHPSFGKSLQAIGLFFFLLRSKGQGFPKLKLPPIPDDTDQAGV